MSNHSPLLHQKMIPFMSSVTCLFEPVNKTPSTTEQHQKRLLDMVESWGFQLHPVEGDGDFFFLPLPLPYVVSVKIFKGGNHTFW